MYNFFLQHRAIVVYGRVVLDDLDVRHGRGREERGVGPVSDVVSRGFHLEIIMSTRPCSRSTGDTTKHHAADDDEHKAPLCPPPGPRTKSAQGFVAHRLGCGHVCSSRPLGPLYNHRHSSSEVSINPPRSSSLLLPLPNWRHVPSTPSPHPPFSSLTTRLLLVPPPLPLVSPLLPSAPPSPIETHICRPRRRKRVH